jgi:beta-phosphoglucomutase-like phosphatase (HAD superfamily)/dTDP-glucose pyrophosphorylase
MKNRRLFIFDLDGVLVDSKHIHFESLNLALAEIDPKYVISEEDQRLIFEGLSTNKKLNILTETRGLPAELHKQIWESKQEKSIVFFKNLKSDKDLINLFTIIKDHHVDIAVASNCIKETVEACLNSLNIIDLVDLYLSNEDVENPKPSPEIYTKCIEHFVSAPKYTTIFEDSEVGKTAALASGANLIEIKDRSSINRDLIYKALDIERKKVNVLIPMAGEGSRFTQAGYVNPKPLIDINGKSMINWVHDNINLEAHYIFIAKSDHIKKYNLKEHIASFCKEFTLISQEGKLDGAALTALLAKDIIDTDEHLVIANSDQYVDWNSTKCIYGFLDQRADGGIVTFEDNHPKWSYVKIKEDNVVSEVVEKIVVSNKATCGIYYWKSGKDFVKYAEQMISKNIRTNNEFYIAPVYNEAIADGKYILFSDANEMHGMGTPEDLDNFFVYLDKRKDIDYQEDVEGVFQMSRDEWCVKYKSPSYEMYDRHLTILEDGRSIWDYQSDLIKVAKENGFGREVRTWVPLPVVSKIHSHDNILYKGRSVYIASYTARFFHIILEILPKLFFLKNLDPNFKLILVADEEIGENGDFLGLVGQQKYGRDGDATCLKFWLDELKIDYVCVNIHALEVMNLSFESSYVFYEHVYNQDVYYPKVPYSKLFFNGPEVFKNFKNIYPFSIFGKGDFETDYSTISYLKPLVRNVLKSKYGEIKKLDKKIYISRKNYDRRHKNEQQIEDYFMYQGYTSVCMEDLNAIEQIKLCMEASDIVCYLGSSMVNFYFIEKDTNIKVLSLASHSDENFNTTMLTYYSGMVDDNNIDIKLIRIPDEFPTGDVADIFKGIRL